MGKLSRFVCFSRCWAESAHLVVGVVLSGVLQNRRFDGGHVEGDRFEHDVFVCQRHLGGAHLGERRHEKL